MVAFIVVSYNEADTIVRTLNSIKYQIDNYAKGRDIQLIIADDCSTDGTADVAARWLDDNGELFKSVKILPAEKNVGTCKNLGKAFRELDTEYFLVIAGDDAISKHDLFRKLNLLDDCDILLNGKLLFDADKLTIIRNRKKYLDTTMQSCEGYGFMRLISGVGCPIQNGAIYKRSLITEDVLQYMERFRLLDDRTRYHVILRKQKLKVKYDNEPILIYGVSNRSVTSVDGGHLSGMAKDLDDFYKVQAYGLLYKGFGHKVDELPLKNITLTIVRHTYPRDMLKMLRDSGIVINKVHPGIYRFECKPFIPVQLVVSSQLPLGEYDGLRLIAKGATVEDIINYAEKAIASGNERIKANAGTVIDVCLAVNKNLGEVKEMYEAVREVFKDAFAKERQEGIQVGSDTEKKRVAVDMLKKNLPFQLIKEISKLSEDVIRNLATSPELAV